MCLQTSLVAEDLPCINAWLAIVLNRAATLVEAGLEANVVADLLNVDGILVKCLKRNRRIDEDYAYQLVESKRAHTIGQICNAMGDCASSSAQAFLPRWSGSYRAEMFRTFSEALHISVACDGGRFGQPKEELGMYTI